MAPAADRETQKILADIPAAARTAADRARADLARRLGITTGEIEILAVKQRYKSSGASDTPGRANGWEISLASGGSRYRYQVDAQGRLQQLP